MFDFCRHANAFGVASVCTFLPFIVYADVHAPDAGQDNLTIERIAVHGQRTPMQDTAEQAITVQSAPDVRDQLGAEPGIAINSNGPVTAILQHRGMFGDRLHVSHQGGSLYGAGPNAMDSPLSHVLSIENPVATVYRGIAPVSAGYESIGGAVKFDSQAWDLSTNNTIQSRGYAVVDYSDNGERSQMGVFAEWVGLEWGLRSALQMQQGDDYQDGNGNSVSNTEYERRMGSVAGTWLSDEHSVDFSLSHNRTDLAGTPALAMDIEYIDATWDRLQYQLDESDALFRVRVFGNNNRHDMSNFALRERMPAMQRRNSVSSDVLGVATDYQFNVIRGLHQLDVSMGAELIEREHQSLIKNPSNERFFINNYVDVNRDVETAFIEMFWRHQGYFATLGIRPTRIALDAGQVGSNMAMMNPNVAALVTQFNDADRKQRRNWVDTSVQFGRELSKSMRVYVNMAEKGRAPSYHELYTWFPLGISAGLADGRNYIGDVNLRHELATQFEIGLDIDHEKWSFRPRVFWYDIEDFIIGRPSQNIPANMISNMMTGQIPLQWQNTDAKIVGADVSLGWQFYEAWRVDSALEWVRGEDTSVDEDLYRLAPHRLDIRLSYQQASWQAYVAAEIVDGQERVSRLQNEQTSSGYGVVNTGFSVEVSQNWRVKGSIENVFDRFYQTHLSGVNRIVSNTLGIGERIPEMGRSVHVSVAYTF